MSTVYRDRDRFDDSRTTASGRTTGGTKVTRYVVKEDDSRSDYDRAKSRYDDNRSYAASRYDDRRTDYDRGDTRVEETKIIRTTREEEEAPYNSRAYSRAEPGFSKSRETITVRRDESPERRDDYWRRPAGEPVEDRELVIRRTVERDNGPAPRERDLAVTRIDDDRRYSDYEIVSSPRPQFDDREREVQRYIRTSEYYQPQPAPPPQTIIIRQEPIILRERERPRDDDYQIVKKSDVEESRSVSRRSDPREEEYFYEKRVKERIPEDDHRDRKFRREVSPHDSVSQSGRRNRGYSSDDSMVYVRKEVRDDYDSDGSEHRGRDLAAGAIAGIGAAELIRRHKDKEGKDVSHGGGRAIRDVGAGIVGAVAAEGIRRYRSKSRKRSRSDSRGRYSRRDSRHRSRSRSGSHSNVKTLGGLGLAAAAVAAGALIANRNKNKGSPDRRSRSRTRRGSSRSRSRASSRASLENDPTATDDRNPKKRNQKTAAAGAVGAAAMALWERHRSKSRGRASSESPNRLKQGAPIVGAGLAAAGLAHMYEKRKARDEADEIIKGERRSRSRTSRSRSRAPSTYYDGPQRSAYSDPNLIQYGNDPLYGNNFGEGYYGRPTVEQDYYNNSTRDVVPAPAPPPATSSFDATNRSARRTRSLSSSATRSRSRSRGAAAAAAAVGAGVAASELQHRSRERKDRKRRSRDRNRSRHDSYTDDRSRQGSYAPYTAGRDPYEDANWHATHSASYPHDINDPYASQSGFYPHGSQFPPPPGSMPQQAYAPRPPPQSYGPQDFPPPPGGVPQGQQFQDPYAPGQNPYAPRPRGADENVSAASSPAPTDQHRTTTDGINGTREAAVSAPPFGPSVTIRRPSTDTPNAQEPRTQFPGSTTNPFQQPRRPTVHDVVTGTVPDTTDTSPGHRSPAPPSSRAAQTYTPPLQQDSSPARDQSASSSATTQPRDIPVVTDAPSPLPMQQRPRPEDPRATAFRNAAYHAPPPSGSVKPPEMQQTNRGNTPFMPSPDIRPPSDDTVTVPQQPRTFVAPNYSGPSMPNLIIPSTYIPPTEERQARDRSESGSRPVSGAATPRAATPGQDQPRKSVKFNPKPEFSDAASATTRDRRMSDSEIDSPEVQRRHRHQRERERERDRDRDSYHRSERHDYDAGDDFSDDTPFEDHRRRSRDISERSEKDRDRGSRHSSRRERSNTQSLDRDSGSARDRARDPKRSNALSGSSSKKSRRRDDSPNSDTTIDLPPRFDEKGRRRNGPRGDDDRSPEQDILAEKLDEIFGGLFGGSSKRR